MTFKDKMKTDMQDVFCNTSHFAETVTFYPSGVIANGFEIEAVVDRDQPIPFELEGEIPVVDFQITIPYETGKVTEINKGEDKIKLLVDPNGSIYTTARIVDILFQDEAGWTVVAVK